MATYKTQVKYTGSDVGAEVDCAAPSRAFAERRIPDPTDLNPPPLLTRRIGNRRIGIRMAPADDRHMVAPLRKNRRQIADVLRGRRNVRIERLVQKQNAHCQA